MKRALFAVAAALFLAGPASMAQEVREIRLPDHVRPIRYDLTVTPNAEDLTLQGLVRIEIDVRRQTPEIELNALDMSFDRVLIDGQRVRDVRFDEETQTAHLRPAQPIAAGRHTIEIAYRGQIYRQAQGLFAQEYEADERQERMLVSQFQAADARRFLPCFDEPAFRALFDVTVIAPQNRVVISNMPETSSENIAGGMKRVRFATSPSMPTYLLFLGVGDFERISQTIAGVEVSIVTKRGDSERGRFALEAAAEVLPWFNEYFGTPYPLPKLDIIAAPGGGGFAAMENWGAILFFEQFLLVNPETTSEALRQFIYTTVAHEIAHMWFGNLVTMAWWDDIWLNEGFATWIENKVTHEFRPEWSIWLQASGAREGAMLLDARESSHPIIVPIANVEQANQAFDQITYQKGYAVIRMFEQVVGEERFRDGVRDYMRRYAYGNTRSTDLWDAIETASGRPLRQVADDFTLQQGVPLISVEAGRCRSNRQALTLRQGEFTALPISREQRLWRVPVSAMPLGGAPSDIVITGEDRAGSIALPGCGAFIVNPDQAGYYRVQYPRAAFERLTRDFARVAPADQLGLLRDARALGRAGQAPASDFFALARQTQPSADPLVLSLIAGEIAATDGLFNANDARRQGFRSFGRSALNPILTRIGWSRRDGESDNTSLLRAAVLGALSAVEDPAFEAEALRRYRANDIDGPVRAVVSGAVGAAATPAQFEQMLERASSETDTLQKRVAYQALANVRDPALARRVLEIAFEPDVDPALGPGMINIVSGNHPEMAFDYALAHPEELAARLDPFTLRSFATGLVGGNDQALLQRARSYIDTQVPASARRTPEAQYAQFQERLATRQRRVDEISAWLAASRAR